MEAKPSSICRPSFHFQQSPVGIVSRLNHDGYETDVRHCGRIAVVSLTLSGPPWKNAVELTDFKADFKRLAEANSF